MAKKQIQKQPFDQDPVSTTAENGRADTTRRVFLILTAFLAGAAVMIIELAGNRVLAPWFGNSLYTWTGLIGVILLSISGGYYLGGYLADKRPDYVILSHLLAASAVLTILVPLLESLLGEMVGSMDVIWGPVLATVLLFAVPGCLLASVSPFAIRLISLLSEDKSVGVSAGSIGMVATLGSVVGTFSAGFLLIPHLRLSTVFLVTGLVLATLSVIGYLLFSDRFRRNKISAVIPVLLFGMLALASQAATPQRPERTIFEQTTFYHKIRVEQRPVSDGDSARFIYLDSTKEGGRYMRESGLMPDRYQDFWMLGKLFCPHLEKGLFLGGGAFAMPQALLDAFSEARVDVVEIDPAVIEVGRRFFEVDEYPRMNPVAADARRFLRLSDARYDLIFGDAYHGVHCIPAHLVTREFFELVKSRLNEGGVYVMNIASAAEGDRAILFLSVARTLAEVFDYQCVFLTDREHPAATQNLFIVAASHELNVESLATNDEIDPYVAASMLPAHFPSDRYDPSQGKLFTDDSNPVEYLVAKALRAD